MKTAPKKHELHRFASMALAAFLGTYAFGLSGAMAVDLTSAPPSVVPPPAAMAPGSNVAVTPPPTATPDPLATKSPDTQPSAAAAADEANKMPPGTETAEATDKVEKGKKSLMTAEDKISDNVKNIAKHIGTTDNVTLDDLNSARQAVAKIDALIDIEKHLNELEKLRSERESHSLSAAIPVSALTAMQSQQSQQPPALQQPQFQMPAAPIGRPEPMPVSMMQPSFASANSIEVMRVIGSGDHCKAIIKTPDGQTKTVAAGDHVEGVGIIKAISSSGVELDQNGTKHVIHVKNVDTVFSATP